MYVGSEVRGFEGLRKLSWIGVDVRTCERNGAFFFYRGLGGFEFGLVMLFG